jgi:hypothetical protein
MTVTKKITYVWMENEDTDSFDLSHEPVEDTIKVKKTEKGYEVLYLVDDGDSGSESPREWCNMGTMVCFHSRYDLGDKHSYDDPDDFWTDVSGVDSEIAEESDVKCLTDIAMKRIEVLPLYLYDHSGITMSTSPFSCGWDSGQVGYIYVTHDKIKEEYGELTIENIGKATKRMQQEVKTYDQYLTGEVFGVVRDTFDNDKNFVEGDSCWGYYGKDNAEECLLEAEDW